MNNSKEFKGCFRLWFGGRWLIAILLLLAVSACSPAAKNEEELHRDVQDLKKEVMAMQEKLDKLQAGQQALLDQLKKAPSLPETAVMPPPQPQVVQPLTVSQLLAGKDQYLGTRVTVRGPAGPVLVHHKSLMLRAPEGMVEVFYDKLSDPRLVQYLSSATLEQPITVTGLVSLPTRGGGTKLRIDAESIDF